ncbi:hypothetical protein Goarm_018729, partial [Gossypium armourianum]|nr:hypothetical protein [Gossypium armourianum]
MSSRDGAMNAPIFVGNGSKVKDSLWMMSQPSVTARLRLNHNEETDPSLGTYFFTLFLLKLVHVYFAYFEQYNPSWLPPFALVPELQRFFM